MTMFGYGNGYGDGSGDGSGDGDGVAHGDRTGIGLRYLVLVERDGMISIGCETKNAEEWLHGDHYELIKTHKLTIDEVATIRRYVEQLARRL